MSSFKEKEREEERGWETNQKVQTDARQRSWSIGFTFGLKLK
jgi:hypothetical protein